MKTLSSRLNFSQSKEHESAVKIDQRKDVNFYETLCAYCADNNIRWDKAGDFNSAVYILENYGQDDISTDYFYFWIE